MIETERLNLRRWRPDDRAPFAAMNADPEVMRYFPAVLDRAASDALIDRIEAGFDEHGWGLWALDVRETGEFIGFTGLIWQTFPAHFTPAVEVGWRLRPSAWGHGYASEAGRAALTVAFDTAGLDEVVSMTAVANAPSRAVMSRLGLTRDPADDFYHPSLPCEHPLSRHVLYRIRRR